MAGFFIKINKQNNSNEMDSYTFKEDVFTIKNNMIDKFNKDTILQNDNNYFIILDGVITNKEELLQNKKVNWNKFFIEEYEKNKNAFFSIFRGSFCGAIYDKKLDNWTIFSDHIGSKQLFFFERNNEILISTNMKEIFSYFKKNNIDYSMNINSAYMLLSYGYMLEDFTICNDVKRLMPGYYLKFSKMNDCTTHQYYKINNTEIERTEEEYIELIDKYFRQAIKRQFDKDLEYGFKHFVALSGGLDSRMTSVVAHKMGYTNQLNFTFSQSNYLDETISKQIAVDLNHGWIFKSLDSGNHLKNIENILNITGGNAFYFPQAQGYSMLNLINFNSLGLNHSGQLGDVIIGTYNNQNHHKEYNSKTGAYSNILIEKINIEMKLSYNNMEEFLLLNRGCLGINMGLLTRQESTETLSPFMDIDFMNFALTIPVKYRYNHYIYKKWILTKYSLAAKYKWENTNDKITAKNIIKYKGTRYTVKEFQRLVINKIKKSFGFRHKIIDMTPLDKWLYENNDLNKYLETYFTDNIDLVKEKDLKKDLISLNNNFTGTERLQAISLVAIIKLFFTKEIEND